MANDFSAVVLVNGVRIVRLRKLLIVQAKPLRELGFGAVLGTVLGFARAYLMCLALLRWAVPRKGKIVATEPTHAFWSRRFALLSLGVILFGIGFGFGLLRVNTDPSLLAYFKPRQPLRDGLEAVAQRLIRS